ncbi:MAG: tetratricopeptide repeat protein [Anaerolineae bacterium]|nr:tetratricopeptide repeat protein [Anaerolineae bacterium]
MPSRSTPGGGIFIPHITRRARASTVVGERDVDLTEKMVDYLEEEYGQRFDPPAAPRPWQERGVARSEEVRQAWGAYLFDKGMEYVWGKHSFAAETYYRAALRLDPGHADAWVHLGNLRFNEGRVSEALAHYQQGQAAAEARAIGDPARYTRPFWGELDSRPFMRALHGRGLCLWRLRQIEEARQVFTWMLALNPSDNQGARFLLHDLDEGLSWEESVAKDEDS